MFVRVAIFFVCPLLLCLELSGQTIDEIYKLDYLAYRKHGNHPAHVAGYFNQLGSEVLSELKNGKRPDLENREFVIKTLSETHSLQQRDRGDLARYMHEAFATGQQRDALGRRTPYYDLQRSHYLESADQIFQLSGADFCRQLVLEQLMSKMRQFTIHERLPDFLSTRSLQLILELTDEQKQQIKQEIDRAKPEFDEQTAKQVAEIRKLFDEQWRTTLDLFNEEQQQKLKEKIGEPIQWYLEFERPFFLNRWSGDYRRGRTIFGLLAVSLRDGKRFADQFSDEELQDAGIQKCNTLVYEMIKNPFVIKQLKLSDGQKELIEKELHDQMNDIMLAAPVANKERINEILNAKEAATYPTLIVDFLTKEQLTRFQQIELTVRICKFPRNGLLHSLSEYLQIGPDQEPRMPEMFTPLHEQSRYLDNHSLRFEQPGFQATNRRNEKLRPLIDLYVTRHRIQRQLGDRLEATLTDAQFEKYREFVVQMMHRRFDSKRLRRVTDFR